MLSPAGSYLLLLCGLLKHRKPLCGYTKESCRAWHPTKGMASQENVLYMYFLTRLPFPDPGWEKLSSTSCLSTRAETCSRRAPAQGLPAQSVVVCGKPGEIRAFICQTPRWLLGGLLALGWRLAAGPTALRSVPQYISAGRAAFRSSVPRGDRTVTEQILLLQGWLCLDMQSPKIHCL